EDDAPLIQRTWPRFFAALADEPEALADFFASVAEIGRHHSLQALRNAASKRVEFALADEAGTAEASVEHFAQRFPQWAAFEHPALSLLEPAARQRWHARSSELGQQAQATPRKAADAVVDAFLLPDEPAYAVQRFALLRKAFFTKE